MNVSDCVRRLTIYPEGKWWFLPRYEVDGVVQVSASEVDADGNVVFNMTAEPIEGTQVDKTNRSTLARVLRWLWRLFHRGTK